MFRLTITLFISAMVAGCGKSDGGTPGTGGHGGGATPPAADLSTLPGQPPTSSDLAVPPTPPASDMATGGGSGGVGGAGSGGVGGAGGGGMGGGGGAGDCTYPMGPYGLEEGKVIDSAIGWDCLVPGSDTPAKVTMKDFLDCKGQAGINAVFLSTSTEWCGGCQQDSEDLPGRWDKRKWGELGVRGVITLTQDKDKNPPTIELAKRWRDTYKLKEHYYVCSDPQALLKPSHFPTILFINPRDMKVTKSTADNIMFPGDELWNELDKLAQMNKK